MSLKEDILSSVDSLIDCHRQGTLEYMNKITEFTQADIDELRHSVELFITYKKFRTAFEADKGCSRDVLNEIVEFMLDMEEE